MHRAALAALIIILPLTLGLRSIRPEAPMIDSQRLAGDASTRLASEGWSVRSVPHHLLGSLISASQRNCQILVHFPAPSGEADEKFRIVAKSIGPVTYRYGGEVRRDFPRIVPVLAWHVQRYAWNFGIGIPTTPVVTIAQSPSCANQVPDFANLRQHFQV